MKEEPPTKQQIHLGHKPGLVQQKNQGWPDIGMLLHVSGHFPKIVFNSYQRKFVTGVICSSIFKMISQLYETGVGLGIQRISSITSMSQDSRNTVTSKTSTVGCGDMFKLLELLEYVQTSVLILK